MKQYIGRFAPSPTGPLHLGSLATALGSYLDSVNHNGQWLVRIEDIDPERCKPEFTEAILKTLHAHSLFHDGEVWLQSKRYQSYQATLNVLANGGCTYPCGCTRKEIDTANASRPFGQNRVYPGTCRQGLLPGKTARAIRFYCPEKPIEWHDHRLGWFNENLSETSGDFVLQRGDGHWAYHLAVVVDDIASQVTHIVRGEDLAETTARQLAIYDTLNSPRPAYWHLPVILAEDGQKLSKQTGAAAIDDTRPLHNLNAVWKHFGLPAIDSNTPENWIKKASPVWARYREKSGK